MPTGMRTAGNALVAGPKESEATRATTRLHNAVEHLSKIMMDLEQKINPILNNNIPTGIDKVPQLEFSSLLAKDIGSAISKVDGIISHVISISTRVEV